MNSNFQNTDEYIAMFPAEVQELLNSLRQTIRNAAPEAEEVISYQMPSYKLNGILVHFAGYKNHIGFYPGPAGIANFIEEINDYKYAKGSVQFPLDQPLPLDLVTQIVQFRVKQNLEKAASKKIKK